ncbi:MAG: glycosyltransferase family 2 protein [Planctomycetota bacterium]|nr:glycosyltransferase family 2 protein [Planctomycetota bacterium]
MSDPLIEIMIPAFNESNHIAEAVTNALELGPVYVLDSMSTDGTPDLARAAGATVVQQPWLGYARQKNWGLDNLPFKGQWVFILDADERITPELRRELLAVAKSDPMEVGFYINRVVIFMGREIRHGGLYPSWNLRFFKRDKCRYEDRKVHEHMIADGATRYLKHEMLHIRRETMDVYFAKHIRYADLESDEWVRMKLGQSKSAAAKNLFGRTMRLRQWLRRDIWPITPGRPFVRFVYQYLYKRGFLDGKAGWHLAQLMFSYEYMIGLMYEQKLRDHRRGKTAK